MDHLRFGSFLAPSLTPLYQAIVDAVGRKLGVTTELIVESSYGAWLEDLNDVCFVCSLPYVMYERQGISRSVPIAAPILSGARYQRAPVYFSDVIVHRDSPFKSFLDLRGQSWAYNEPLSQSGYGIPRYHLVALGETNGFFGSVVESGFHQESIRMVLDQEVDGSAIDSQVLAVALRDNPELLRSLRIVDALGPSTIKPVTVSKRIGLELRDEILGVLLGLHEDPQTRSQLEFGMVARYTRVGPGSFGDIHRMVTACDAAGFIQLR